MVSLSKTDALHLRLRTDILSLRLAPGAPLRLPALADNYAAGLTPLRECLNRLAGEKLVIPAHNKGFRVAPLSRADLLDLEHTRAAIEGRLFADAITAGDAAWEAAIIGSFHQLQAAQVPTHDDEMAGWAPRHAAFHDALLAAAPSRRLHQFRAELSDHLTRYQRHIADGLWAQAAASQALSRAVALAPHQTLYDIAMARDAEAALGAMYDHAQLSINAFAQLEDLQTQVPA